MTMIIYGATLSPFVRKTVVVASEKGLDFEMRTSGPAPGQRSAEFSEASPLGKIPALRDGDFTLADSSAIIHYLDAKYPDRPMIPAEPEACGRTIWFEEYADTVMMACGAKIFFNRFVAPKIFKRPGDEALAEAAERDELPVILDYLESVVPDGEAFLVGDGLTLADIAIACPLATLGHVGIEAEAKRHPRLARFLERIMARPSFARCLEPERALVARFAD